MSRKSIHHHEHRRKRIQKFVFYGVIFMFVFASFVSFGNLTMFKASILPTKPVPAFNGTAAPVKLVPNWSKLTSSEWNLPYSSIPQSKLISLPKYDPNLLKIPTDSLKYGNANDDITRNTKLTYPVPYLGGYKLDGLENTGSHPAIDIKIPMDTPVYAIANGAVIKTETSSSGFGNHIVVMHENVPVLNNPSQKITLYSSYSHLNKILVSEGDVVLKGQQIGFSGESGLASAPHLHFQIDTDSAPWHPYWPFTYKDISDAGLKTFNNAINSGLGKNKAALLTINPMNYTQEYISYTPSGNTINAIASNDSSTNTASSITSTISTTESATTVTINLTTLNFKITSKPSYMWNEGVVFAIKMYSGDQEYSGNFDGVLNVSLSNSSIGMLDKTSFIASDFTKGSSNVSLINPSPGKAQVVLDYNARKFYSNDFEISDKGFNPRERVVFTDEIRSDLQGSTLFADISQTFPNYRALEYLKNKGIISGYSDGTFKPEQVVSRAEALKFILESAGVQTGNVASISFSDVKSSDWFVSYVMTAASDNIVKGYSDGTFKPTSTVNKTEFLKMLLLAMKVDINPLVAAAPYNDVLPSEWYAPYVNFAKDKNLVAIIGSQFGPSEGMKRKDVAEVIYRVMILKETGADRYTEGLASAQ